MNETSSKSHNKRIIIWIEEEIIKEVSVISSSAASSFIKELNRKFYNSTIYTAGSTDVMPTFMAWNDIILNINAYEI